MALLVVMALRTTALRTTALRTTALLTTALLTTGLLTTALLTTAPDAISQEEEPRPASRPCRSIRSLRADLTLLAAASVSRIELASDLVWLTKLRRRCSSSGAMPNLSGSLAMLSTAPCSSSKSSCEHASRAGGRWRWMRRRRWRQWWQWRWEGMAALEARRA